MMEYTVSIAVNGRAHITVKAESFEEAKEKALSKFCDADIGDLECVDWSAVNAESETGEFKDF